MQAPDSMPALYCKSPERVDRYMALLPQRLRTLSYEPMSTSTISSPEMSSSDSSASPSPTLEAQQHGFPQLSPPAYALPKPMPTMIRKSSSMSASKVAPIPEDELLEEFELRSPTTSSDEGSNGNLYAVNAEIKSTLMDLLNTEAVRNDGKMRAYIQSKLMEAEMELKKQRRHNSGRRRSSTPRIVLTPTNEEA